MTEKKSVSARFVMAVGFSLTYCFIMIACVLLTGLKILTAQTFIALLGGFALIVREIVNDYFERKDRIKKEEQNG